MAALGFAVLMGEQLGSWWWIAVLNLNSYVLGDETLQHGPPVYNVYLMYVLPHKHSSVNYRGSAGYGQDSIFSLPGKVGTQDVNDVQVLDTSETAVLLTASPQKIKGLRVTLLVLLAFSVALPASVLLTHWRAPLS